MSKKVKVFLLIIIISMPFWLGINYLKIQIEDFAFAEKITENPPEFYLAEISFEKKNQRPDLKINSEIALSAKINSGGETSILFEKNKDKKVPIASLTKLMTAIVADEFYKPDIKTRISENAVDTKEPTGQLSPGERWKVKKLLRLVLIESSNDAAFALAEKMGKKAFVDLMNLKAKRIGMENTTFTNPTGLDKEDSFAKKTGTSSAFDLLKLGKYLIEEKPNLIKIMNQDKKEISLNGSFHHVAYNTNKLLDWPLVKAGKTGYTDKAQGCLFLLMEKDSTYYLNLILSSEERFEEMIKLVEYVNSLTH